ncbi:ABC transporter permease [Pseudoxanthobacter sp. M-2]|uniref:ABC transporter permease n=1 Tax=Pseudoxanthobacter sp. M-2 TaxID=3078754 RepID=UPI0038FC553F
MDNFLSLLSFGPDGWGDQLAAGTWMTIRLAVATVPFGLVLGFFIALAKVSERRWLRFIGETYTTVFRGLPELLTLFIIYYGGQVLLQRVVSLVAPNAQVEVNSFVAGMFALGMVFAAYASEAFVGAIRAIGKGQFEAGDALGMRRATTWFVVVLPQLIRLSLPALGNLWLVLLKDTSLVSVIALNDLLRMTNIAVGATKQPFFFYLVALLIYLALSIISSIGLSKLETRFGRGYGAAR